MHRLHDDPAAGKAPHTTGLTIHWAGRYDTLSRLLGLGVNRPNSRMVVEMAGIKPGDRVLDVGCGTGSLTLTAAEYAGPSGHVHGIDASPEMIEVARAKAGEARYKPVFDLGAAEQMPYQEGDLDVVISRLVIHHLPHDLKSRAFSEVYRVLRPGGLFFIADFRPPANPLLAHLSLAIVGHRMMRFDIEVIPPLLSQAGFVDVTSGPTRSAFLAFASGRKPASRPS